MLLISSRFLSNADFSALAESKDLPKDSFSWLNKFSSALNESSSSFCSLTLSVNFRCESICVSFCLSASINCSVKEDILTYKIIIIRDRSR